MYHLHTAVFIAVIKYYSACVDKHNIMLFLKMNCFTYFFGNISTRYA